MNEMITISMDEYDALIGAKEDLADILEAQKIIQQLDTGKTESVPDTFVKRLLDGESVLKLWREHRGLTQTALAEKSGVNRVQITDIESGKKSGSVATLKKLADALDVLMDDLV